MEGMTHAGPGERIVVTTDDTTAAAADALAAVFREHGFVVGRHTFIPGPTEAPRRVALIALPCPLPELVALVTPPTALPGLVAALVQLKKAAGAFASISARTGLELTDAFARWRAGCATRRGGGDRLLTGSAALRTSTARGTARECRGAPARLRCANRREGDHDSLEKERGGEARDRA